MATPKSRRQNIARPKTGKMAGRSRATQTTARKPAKQAATKSAFGHQPRSAARQTGGAENKQTRVIAMLQAPSGASVDEEIGLPYEPHLVDFNEGDQKTPEFLSLNPNGKIPAIIDPNGPGGKPLPLFESGAILQYLAEKTSRLLPDDAARRWETIQWVYFQMAFIGPMFGQVGFFNKFAGKDYEDKRPRDRYVNESKRLLGVMESRLEGRQWFMADDYTIADVSMLGWVRNLIGFYGARELVAFDSLKHVPAWLDRGLARPAVQRGLQIPRRD